jgi:hypothetical protein
MTPTGWGGPFGRVTWKSPGRGRRPIGNIGPMLAESSSDPASSPPLSHVAERGTDLAAGSRAVAHPEVEQAARQLGLFVIWEKGRGAADRILADLADRFDVLHVYDVHWSRSLVTQNYRRFYNDVDVRGIFHLEKKGAGPFLAVTVLDRAPLMEERVTARGSRLVNSRLLDAKLTVRGWTSEYAVHCGETEWENSRDITMLLGEDPRSHLQRSRVSWDGRVERLDRDVVGARGWSSSGELFRVLNEAELYTVLEPEDAGAALDTAVATVEILAGPRSGLSSTLPTILNAMPRFLAVHAEGGRFRVSVGGRSVSVTIRHVGDQLLDARWEADLIARRELDARGWYRLSRADAAEVRAYRALMHRASLDRPGLEAQVGEARAAGAAPRILEALARPEDPRAPLIAFLGERGYALVRPLDLSVPFRHEVLGIARPGVRRTAERARLGARLAARSLTGPIGIAYHAARDRFLLAAPWLRDVRRMVARTFR